MRSAVVLRYVIVLALSWACFSHLLPRARAQEDATARAAQLFDQGVSQFKRGEYVAAMESFLAADATSPSAQSLTNALYAAQQAHDALMVARIAARVLERPQVDPKAVARAREGLAAAAPQLGRLDVTCTPSPCTMTIDGEPLLEGGTYVIPGAHQVLASWPSGVQAAENLSCAAGGSYELTLRQPAVPAAAESSQAASAEPSQAQEPAQTPSAPTRRPNKRSRQQRAALGVFYGSVAASTLFIALTTWSGLDAMAARDLYDDDPARYDRQDVRQSARRTDYLLAGSILFAAASLGTGLFWVEWRPRTQSHLSLLPTGGATLMTQTRF